MSHEFSVISIVGTTAVGKSDFALSLAEKLVALGKYSGIDIISADSRQIYQGLEILSGADIPNGFTKEKDLSVSAFSFFQKKSIRLFGVSCIMPDQEWSVSQFQTYALQLITQAKKNKRVVLVVGGTGLYHEHLSTSDMRLHIPPNEELRNSLNRLSVSDLQGLLESADANKLLAMNNSDRNNPRRLIRAIEIATYGETESQNSDLTTDFKHIYIGLEASLDTLVPKINTRVKRRLDAGVVQEIETLLRLFGDRLSEQVETTLGYKQVLGLIDGSLEVEEAIESWTLAEKQYAQRQMTWWRAKAGINWININANEDWREIAADVCLKLID